MKHRIILFALMILTAAVLGSGCSSQKSQQASTGAGSGKCSWQVYFSPNGGCTQAVVNTVGKAKKTVLVQAYSFTSAPIAKALVDTQKRGVKVQIILDRSQVSARYSSADFFRNMHIPLRIDYKHAIAHNKVMVIDGQTVITGSFNFTKSAEYNNAENLLIINDPKLADRYTANWKIHWNHSEPYTGRGSSKQTTRRYRHYGGTGE